MPNTNIILAVVCLLLLIVIFIYKNFVVQKRVKTILVHDSNTAEYNKQKNNSYQRLTLKEQTELSWKFLYVITEIVVNKFSETDIALVNQLGYSLINNGMKYEHVIDFTIKQTTLTRENLEQGQSQTKTRSV